MKSTSANTLLMTTFLPYQLERPRPEGSGPVIPEAQTTLVRARGHAQSISARHAPARNFSALGADFPGHHFAPARQLPALIRVGKHRGIGQGIRPSPSEGCH